MQVLKGGSRKFDTGDNWDVHHPNGKHMFTTNRRKIDWYIKRNLATIVGERSIQLTFEPNGLGFNEDEIFGLTPRVNQCVVCAAQDNLQRHHVVPYHYRKFMPIDYKSRNHHDVVLICRKHHEEYEMIAKAYKTFIAAKYNVKTIEELNNDYITNVVERLRKKFKISKLLNTFLKQFNVLPIKNTESIAKELEVLVGFNILDMTLDEIEKINSKLNKSIAREKKEVINVDDFYHGKAVVKQFTKHSDFEEFIKGWRQHFLDTMKPEFMPVGWSIDFRCRK
jgi:exonuclease 3'-5' domain-containing protein 2